MTAGALHAQILQGLADELLAAAGLFHQIGDLGVGQGASLGGGSLALDERAAQTVEIHIASLQQRGLGGEDDVFAGDFLGGVTELQLDAVLAGKSQLRLDVLAGAGVFGLLGNDDLILIQLLCQGEGAARLVLPAGPFSMPSRVARASVM